MPTEPLEVIKVIGGGSVATLLFFFLVGGYKEKPWWVFANYHDRVVALLERHITDRDETIAELKAEIRSYREMTTTAVDVSRDMVEVVKAKSRMGGES